MEINQTRSFLLLGFTEDPDLQPLFFGLFQFLYLVTFAGNLAIILAIISDPHLHTPMYFFLSHLSLLDTCYTSVITPQVLATLAAGRTVISYSQCAAQFFFFTIFKISRLNFIYLICVQLHKPASFLFVKVI